MSQDAQLNISKYRLTAHLHQTREALNSIPPFILQSNPNLLYLLLNLNHNMHNSIEVLYHNTHNTLFALRNNLDDLCRTLYKCNLYTYLPRQIDKLREIKNELERDIIVITQRSENLPKSYTPEDDGYNTSSPPRSPSPSDNSTETDDHPDIFFNSLINNLEISDEEAILPKGLFDDE